MSDQIAVAGQRLFELFAACAAAPDDESAGHAADQALRELEALLAADRPASGVPPTDASASNVDQVYLT